MGLQATQRSVFTSLRGVPGIGHHDTAPLSQRATCCVRVLRQTTAIGVQFRCWPPAAEKQHAGSGGSSASGDGGFQEAFWGHYDCAAKGHRLCGRASRLLTTRHPRPGHLPVLKRAQQRQHDASSAQPWTSSRALRSMPKHQLMSRAGPPAWPHVYGTFAWPPRMRFHQPQPGCGRQHVIIGSAPGGGDCASCWHQQQRQQWRA